MALRRGFKTEAEMIARDVRQELALGSTDPLDPWILAEHLCLPVLPLSALLSQVPEAVGHFQRVEPDAFSAVTVFEGNRRLIVHNDSHSRPRQVSNLTHEIAHALLHHPPSPPLSDHDCRDFNVELEEEANWLAGTLLVPEEAALRVVSTRLRVREAAIEYGVSTQMMQFRINVTGARVRVARSRRFLARRILSN